MGRVLSRIRRAVLPRGARVRRVPLGPGSGLKVEIDFDADASFYFGYYEIPLNRYFRRLVRRGDKCFDVGAYRGWHALVLAKLTAAPVVTFDTNPATAELIRRNAWHNGFDITLKQGYVGSGEPGTISLDDAAREFFTPDFIKMDIEGGEARALEGAAGILSRRKPAIIIETHGADQEARCIAILRTHGYDPRIVEESGWHRVLEQRSEAVNRWLVCAGRDRDAPG